MCCTREQEITSKEIEGEGGWLTGVGLELG